MPQSSTDILDSEKSTIRLGKTACAREISRLYKEKDHNGMHAFATAFQDYWVRRFNDPSFLIGFKQAAFRNLDEASYMADLLLRGVSQNDVLQKSAEEIRGVPQHLWDVGEARRFYHDSIDYKPPFGAQGFYAVLDNCVYSMPIFLSNGKQKMDARVWFLINKFVLSEDTAIDYLKNKIVELEELVKKFTARAISEDIKASSLENVNVKIPLTGMTELERDILSLPEDVKQKLVAGYEDCARLVRKNIEVPKEPADYISVKLGVIPGNIADGTRPEVRDSNWYDVTMDTFKIQMGTPLWGEIVPFEQIGDHKPEINFDGIPRDKTWNIYQAVVNAYSFFSDPVNFAKLVGNQNLVPEEFLLAPVEALNSNTKVSEQN